VIRIGPAGWAYKDWEGIVYPKPKPRGFDPVAFLCRLFDTIEINSSFYGPPRPEAVRAWIRRVESNPRFRFTAKLWRGFTHERNADSQNEADFKEGMDRLSGACRLGALLLQFPWSFRYSEETRAYLIGLVARFREYPLVVEVRHASWNHDNALAFFADLRVGLCNIDQPLIGRSLKPSAYVTSEIGYIRLHGRNYKQWFTENQRPSDRYDYLYSLDELEPWVDRIKQVAGEAKDTYVVANNHFLGKAVVNALEIGSLLGQSPVEVPTSLVNRYPKLGGIRASGESLELS